MKNGPPQRLMHDPAALPELRADLQQAAAATAHYDVTAGLSALQANLGTSTPSQGPPAQTSIAEQTAASAATSSGASVSSVVGLSLTAKLSVSAVVAVVAAGAMIGLQTKRAEPVPQTQSAQRAVATDPLTASGFASEPTQVPPPQMPAVPQGAEIQPTLSPGASPRATASDAHHPAVTHNAAARSAKPVAKSPDLRREISELAQLKALLPTDPSAAYRLASAGHARFGHGMLYPEREALAVLALAAMRREDEARMRGQRFINKYPDSPMRSRVESAIADESQAGERAQ